MKGWKQLLEDLRAIMLEFPSHYVMPGFRSKAESMPNSTAAWAIEEALAQFDAECAQTKRLEAENKKLRAENQTLQEALAHWQGVVRVAREKDSTLPDPEAVPC